jgi:hypothetical protein
LDDDGPDIVRRDEVYAGVKCDSGYPHTS